MNTARAASMANSGGGGGGGGGGGASEDLRLLSPVRCECLTVEVFGQHQ